MAAKSIKFGTIVPQGWRLDLRHIDDQVEKYETMTRVAQEAERLGFDSIWVYDGMQPMSTTLLLPAGQTG